jgi:L-2-hydroxyglutarate oxidase LhgO
LTTDVDAVVVGAGVVGLAVARALALSGLSVVVLECEASFGTGTSSRNSEVIHAGLYYPTGSLKARLCVDGRRKLYAHAAERGVPFLRCGKLVVAVDESEIAAIEALHSRGQANGVEGLRLISGAEARRLEPELQALAALLSDETGILDSHAYMSALQADAETAGAAFAFHTPFERAVESHGALLVFAGGVEPTQVSARMLINCAGLHASRVACAIEGVDADGVPATRFAKGNYFALGGRAPFSRLIYPAPHAHGLGVHLTFDLGGQARFGPDVEWVETIDHGVDPARGLGFATAIRRYWPGLPETALMPAYCGIRPKLGGPDDPAADFRFDVSRRGDIAVVSLFGIESPGLTSSLAIADHVLGMIA